MEVVRLICMVLAFHISGEAYGAAIPKEQSNPGLYGAEDKITVFNSNNFPSELYGKQHGWLIEFYNSYCGACRNFAPIFKQFALSVHSWNRYVKVGAIDCSDDDNNGICRNFEIFAYPTIRYYHEDYAEMQGNLGKDFLKGVSHSGLESKLAMLMEDEQSRGRGKLWPSISKQNFTSLAEFQATVPSSVEASFLIFESTESYVGAEIILDFGEIKNVKILRVSDKSALAKALSIVIFPSVYVSLKDHSSQLISINTTRDSIESDLIDYMTKHSIKFPNDFQRLIMTDKPARPRTEPSKDVYLANTVYQADLEAGLRYTLKHEITKINKIEGIAMIALKKYITAVSKYFPFKGNGQLFMNEVRDTIEAKNEINADYFAELIRNLEVKYDPVYTTDMKWVGCKGSAPNYRGFTCSLWQMFHAMTVTAAAKNLNGAEVLEAMLGYISNFFGCTDCAQHFSEMSVRNHMSAVDGNDRAIIWLWIAHNQVNQRLSGDETDDPVYPKQQFPPALYCPSCRNEEDKWRIDEVLIFLKRLYAADNVNIIGRLLPNKSISFSDFDRPLLWFLYIYCIVAVVFILQVLLSKRTIRKPYVNGMFRKM